MKIIGLTGSIGMGKSTTAHMFRDAGAMVFDADAEVHRLQAKDGAAIPAIAAVFPAVVHDGVLDRDALGKLVFSDKSALIQLEQIIHPLLADIRADFFANAKAAGVNFVILDIPLLYEKGGDKGCDAVIVVTADDDVQAARVLARPQMTPEKFAGILASQVPDAEKRARADYIIDTGFGMDAARARVAEIIMELDS